MTHVITKKMFSLYLHEPVEYHILSCRSITHNANRPSEYAKNWYKVLTKQTRARGLVVSYRIRQT
jgi:hypothetical protein